MDSCPLPREAVVMAMATPAVALHFTDIDIPADMGKPEAAEELTKALAEIGISTSANRVGREALKLCREARAKRHRIPSLPSPYSSTTHRASRRMAGSVSTTSAGGRLLLARRGMVYE